MSAAFEKAFPLMLAVSTCVAAPLTEEMVFRMTLGKLIPIKVLYVIVSALLFAFIHTASFVTISNTFYIIAGAIYCVAWLVMKDIRVLIIAHFIWNTTVLVISLLGG